jgi:lipooligosaccharide transport system permease protein
MAVPLALRVVESEARWYRRVWRGSIFSSFLSPVLYLLAMGVGLGSLVDASLPDGLEGVSYLNYLAPGLLAATAMQTGAGEGAWKVRAGIKWTRTYHAKLATPIGIPSLVGGHMLWAGMRVMMVSIAFAIVVVLFRVAPLWQTLAATAPALLVGLAMAAITTAYTVRTDADVALPTFFRFVVIPMFLFSGVFFPITQLPGFLQPVAYITPLFHGAQLGRAVMLGAPTAVVPWISVTYLLALAAVATALAVGPFRKQLLP